MEHSSPTSITESFGEQINRLRGQIIDDKKRRITSYLAPESYVELAADEPLPDGTENPAIMAIIDTADGFEVAFASKDGDRMVLNPKEPTHRFTFGFSKKPGPNAGKFSIECTESLPSSAQGPRIIEQVNSLDDSDRIDEICQGLHERAKKLISGETPSQERSIANTL